MPVYLDNHATTPVDPRVLQALLPYFSEKFGNAANLHHTYGQEASTAVETARQQVARLLNVEPDSLIFTSGATEANNLAIKGVMQSVKPGRHLVTVAAEHRSVLAPVRRLQRNGYETTIVDVDATGAVDPHQIEAALRSDTVLVSCMLANNEVGTINDLAAVVEICHRQGVMVHTDAAQAVGKLPLDLQDLPVDFLSLSGHKLYASKGVGVLYARPGRQRKRIEPLLEGGGHEQNWRSGTLPVPLIVGLGKACELAGELRAEEQQRVAGLRDRLWAGLQQRLTGITCHGHPTRRLAGNLNVSFAGVDGDALLNNLNRIAVSSGAACSALEREPSHVLRAMGIPGELCKSSLRFGIGRFNTAEEIDLAIEHVADVVCRLRKFTASLGK